MKTTVRNVPFVPVALAATFLVAFGVLFAPLSASAHDELLSSSPESGSTVDTLPAEITLTFNEKPLAGTEKIVVLGPDCAPAIEAEKPAPESYAGCRNFAAGDVTQNGAILTQQLDTSNAPAGTYRILWQVTSSDSHPINSEGRSPYLLTVTTSTTPAPSATQSAEPASATPSAVASSESSDNTGVWLLGIIGVLVVLAVIVILATRRRRPRSAGSSDPSAR